MKGPTKGRKRMILVGAIALGFLIAAWLVGAVPADAQEPDSIVVEQRASLPINSLAKSLAERMPGPTFHSPDSILLVHRYEAGAEAAAEQMTCECGDGLPDWFLAGTLVLGLGALWVWHNRETATWTNEQNVTITRTRVWRKKKPWHPGHPGE